MNRIIYLSIILALVCALPALAKDITMTLNQTDYYFLVGEAAVIPLQTDNSYGTAINGDLSYTMTQQVIQQGFQMSTSNTQSKPLTVENGKNMVTIGFGTQEKPTILKVSLTFSYTENGARSVTLDEIQIHFVQDESQKQNEQNQKQSSSQQANQQQQQNQNSLQQQMQNQINQMLGNQAQQQQTTDQRLQNNQMDQDSSALKQQMQNQMQEEQQEKEEFGRNLANTQEFQQNHQQLLQQGYNLTSANLNPINNNTGDFELSYDKNGETATLKGSMENGTIKNMEKTTSEDLKNIMQLLSQNQKFQKYDKELQNELYAQQPPEMDKEGNLTTVKIPYLNQENKTASIQASLLNNSITSVSLDKPNAFSIWWLALAFLVLGALACTLYIRFYKKKPVEEKTYHSVKPIDFIKEARRMLEESKQLFRQKKEKDAYGKAAESLRFYYSYKLEQKTELTNYELIKMLKKNKVSFQDTQKCLNLCSLVEFAKYVANQQDFDEIVSIAEKVIV
jgi:hypothetical protein